MTLIRLIDYPLMGEGARNIYDPALVKSFGLKYHGIGRGEPLVV